MISCGTTHSHTRWLSPSQASLLPSITVQHTCRQITNVWFEYVNNIISVWPPQLTLNYTIALPSGWLSFFITPTSVTVTHYFPPHTLSSSRTSLNCVLRPQRRQPGFWTQPSQLGTAASAPAPPKKNTGTHTCCLHYIYTSIAWKRQEKEEVSTVCYNTVIALLLLLMLQTSDTSMLFTI